MVKKQNNMPGPDGTTTEQGRQWTLADKGNGYIKLQNPDGQTVELPAMRPPGFLDAANYPVSPRADAAYAALNQQLDALAGLATAAKRRKLQEQGSTSLHVAGNGSLVAATQQAATTSTAAGAAGSSGAVCGENMQQQSAQGDPASEAIQLGLALNDTAGQHTSMGPPSTFQHSSNHNNRANALTPGRASRFKPLSVEVGSDVAAGGTGQGTSRGQDKDVLTPLADCGLTLPSPSNFLTSGPMSLENGSSFGLDLLSARGAGPSPRSDSLMKALGSAMGPGPGGHLLHGDIHMDLTTPTIASMVNGSGWSPKDNGNNKDPGGFSAEEQMSGCANGAEDVMAVDGPELVVLGRGIDASKHAQGNGTGETPRNPDLDNSDAVDTGKEGVEACASSGAVVTAAGDSAGVKADRPIIGLM